MTALWVEQTSRICEVWRDGEHSIRDCFQAAEPDLSDRQAFTDGVNLYLRASPELCDRWQDYVNGKRWTPSALLDLREPTTAWMTSKGQRFCNRAFNSAVDACSHFLWMEANWVLQGTRTCSTSVPIAQLVALGEKKPFDAGEYDHGDGKDPVRTYTVPALRDIITEFGA